MQMRKLQVLFLILMCFEKNTEGLTKKGEYGIIKRRMQNAECGMGGVFMTQTNKRVVKIVAVTLLAAVVLSLCVYGFFYGVGKIFFSTHEKKLTKFDGHFVNVCQECGLDVTQAEFLSGTYRTALRDSSYFVSFRVPAEKEYLLFAEKKPGKYSVSESDKRNLPDDGVEYVWRSDMYRLRLYRSDAAEDGYVYCYVDYSYY